MPKLRSFMVSEESVEKSCETVGQYTDEQIAGEFERFFRAQPSLCEFIVEVTHESGQHIQELSLFLSYMIFKTFETSELTPAEAVKPEAIEAAYRETESWMNRISLIVDGEMEDAVT